MNHSYLVESNTYILTNQTLLQLNEIRDPLDGPDTTSCGGGIRLRNEQKGITSINWD